MNADVAAGGPRDRWVTKSDIMRYRRCPYAFWLRDRGLIDESDYLGPASLALIVEGQRWEEKIVAEVPLDPRPLDELLTADTRLHEPGLFANEELGLRGAPDAIDTTNGGLVPIEIKLHRRPRPEDALELAFYWLVLGPYRTRKVDRPVGRLLVPDPAEAGELAEYELSLLPRHFRAVHKLVGAVRLARVEGVVPRRCSCEICAGPMADTIAVAMNERDDVTLVVGIGRPYAEALELRGIDTVSALANADVGALEDIHTASGARPGSRQLACWKRRAQSLLSGQIVRSDGEPPLPERGIVIDFEFDSIARHIWLIGAIAIGVGETSPIAWWADTPDSERVGLERLNALMIGRPELPLITWNGKAAELPALRASAARFGMEGVVECFSERHFDLYQHVLWHVGLPIGSLGLPAVSTFAGLTPSTGIGGGIDAAVAFSRWAGMAEGDQRAALRAELEEYNRDDLRAIVAVLQLLSRPSGV